MMQTPSGICGTFSVEGLQFLNLLYLSLSTFLSTRMLTKCKLAANLYASSSRTSSGQVAASISSEGLRGIGVSGVEFRMSLIFLSPFFALSCSSLQSAISATILCPSLLHAATRTGIAPSRQRETHREANIRAVFLYMIFSLVKASPSIIKELGNPFE